MKRFYVGDWVYGIKKDMNFDEFKDLNKYVEKALNNLELYSEFTDEDGYTFHRISDGPEYDIKDLRYFLLNEFDVVFSHIYQGDDEYLISYEIDGVITKTMTETAFIVDMIELMEDNNTNNHYNWAIDVANQIIKNNR